MTEIRLTRIELKEILKAMDDLCSKDEFASVKIGYDFCEIGATVTATYDLHHNGYNGEYTIHITSDRDW